MWWELRDRPVGRRDHVRGLPSAAQAALGVPGLCFVFRSLQIWLAPSHRVSREAARILNKLLRKGTRLKGEEASGSERRKKAAQRHCPSCLRAWVVLRGEWRGQEKKKCLWHQLHSWKVRETVGPREADKPDIRPLVWMWRRPDVENEGRSPLSGLLMTLVPEGISAIGGTHRAARVALRGQRNNGWPGRFLWKRQTPALGFQGRQHLSIWGT